MKLLRTFAWAAGVSALMLGTATARADQISGERPQSSDEDESGAVRSTEVKKSPEHGRERGATGISPTSPSREEPGATSATGGTASGRYERGKRTLGAAILIGGGVTDFANNEMDNLTDPGGEWDVRAAVGTRSYIGFEAQYLGAAQNISALGLDADAALVKTGLEGALRVNVPLTRERHAREKLVVIPYALGGLGWNRFDVVNDSFNTSAVSDSDNIMTLPLGGGVAFSSHGFMFDTRFLYRFSYGEDLLAVPGAGQASIDRDLASWSANAMLGYEF